MSKLMKFFAIAALIAGALALTPGDAQARWHGGWGGGGWGWGPGWGWGGYPYPYYGGAYYGRPYYGGPGCGWVRVWRRGHWVLRRSPRCW